MNGMKIGALIGGVVFIVILFGVGGALYPTISSQADQFNVSISRDINESGGSGNIGDLIAGSLLAILVVTALVFSALKVFKVL